jgi:hypothetical protein
MTAVQTICATWLCLAVTVAGVYAAERDIDTLEPASAIEVYLRAVYARDFTAAYRLISSEDRNLRDVNRYLQQRGPFSGFTLAVARNLSESLEVTLVRQEITENRAKAVVRYRLPDAEKLAPLVFNWNAYQLNSLSSQDRKNLIDHLQKQKRAGLLAMSEGTEAFELVKEGDHWRIFLNWAAGIRIPLRLDLSKSIDLDATLSKEEVILQPGDLFEIALSLRNRTGRPVTVRIGHLVEPAGIADYLDFVECGFLRPVTIEAGQQRQFSGTYMLRGSLPEGVRQLTLTYDFRLLK